MDYFLLYYTKIVKDYEKKSNFRYMINDAKRYIPLLENAVYKDSIYEVKTVQVKNETDDGRPILFTKDYEIVYINVIPIDDFTTRIRFKVKLNKGLNFKTKVAIIVDSDDLFIEFDDSKYSQLIFNIDHNSIIELKISSKQLPINNELISNISYKIQDVDSSIQYINIKDI